MSETIRVLTYNIHKGFSTANRNFVLARMREAIHEVHADLVMLQEVLGQHEVHGQKIADWPTEPQFEYLADKLWPHYAYGKNAVYTSGHHGNAILSKFPIIFCENIDISTNKLERRGLLHAVIEVPNQPKPLHAICVHLGLLETERRAQVESICKRIDDLVPHDEPLVIAGDFNDWRTKITRPLAHRAEVKEVFLELRGNHARTFPSWLPALRLDRIYYRGLKPQDAKTFSETPWNQLSDHVALFAELVLGA